MKFMLAAMCALLSVCVVGAEVPIAETNKAVASGNSAAQFERVRIYANGDGVTTNAVETEKRGRKSAEQGDADTDRAHIRKLMQKIPPQKIKEILSHRQGKAGGDTVRRGIGELLKKDPVFGGVVIAIVIIFSLFRAFSNRSSKQDKPTEQKGE